MVDILLNEIKNLSVLGFCHPIRGETTILEEEGTPVTQHRRSHRELQLPILAPRLACQRTVKLD